MVRCSRLRACVNVHGVELSMPFAVRRGRQHGCRVTPSVVGQGQLHKEDLCQGVTIVLSCRRACTSGRYVERSSECLQRWV